MTGRKTRRRSCGRPDTARSKNLIDAAASRAARLRKQTWFDRADERTRRELLEVREQFRQRKTIPAATLAEVILEQYENLKISKRTLREWLAEG